MSTLQNIASKQKKSLKIEKIYICLLPVNLSFQPPIIAQSTNNFAEENNLQWFWIFLGQHCTRKSPV